MQLQPQFQPLWEGVMPKVTHGLDLGLGHVAQAKPGSKIKLNGLCE